MNVSKVKQAWVKISKCFLGGKWWMGGGGLQPTGKNVFRYKKVQKSIEKAYFNQCLECASPKCWSKYTTTILDVLLNGIHSTTKNTHT